MSLHPASNKRGYWLWSSGEIALICVRATTFSSWKSELEHCFTNETSFAEPTNHVTFGKKKQHYFFLLVNLGLKSILIHISNYNNLKQNQPFFSALFFLSSQKFSSLDSFC